MRKFKNADLQNDIEKIKDYDEVTIKKGDKVDDNFMLDINDSGYSYANQKDMLHDYKLAKRAFSKKHATGGTTGKSEFNAMSGVTFYVKDGAGKVLLKSKRHTTPSDYFTMNKDKHETIYIEAVDANGNKKIVAEKGDAPKYAKGGDVDEAGGKKVGKYKGMTIYDKGTKAKAEYRFYMRGKPEPPYEVGAIVANGKTLKQVRADYNSNVQEHAEGGQIKEGNYYKTSTGRIGQAYAVSERKIENGFVDLNFEGAGDLHDNPPSGSFRIELLIPVKKQGDEWVEMKNGGTINKTKMKRLKGSKHDAARKAKPSGYRFKTKNLEDSSNPKKVAVGEKMHFKRPEKEDIAAGEKTVRGVVVPVYHETRKDKSHSDDNLIKKREDGGTVNEISVAELEAAVGRKLDGWADGVVVHNGKRYEKCFLRPYYKFS